MLRVMLVDDEADALQLLEILLGQIGGVEIVGKFASPVQAMEALGTTHVDAVFLDNQMPGMTGMEAARKIKEIKPRMPIVFTTAYSEYAVEAFEVQSIDYLLKPIAPGRLQQAVSRIRQAVFADQARPDASPHPAIRCMGGFSIQLPHDAIRLLPWKTNKEKEICAFLIHHEGTPVDTALIIDSIWPGYDLKKAKTYFYTCLSYLRKSLQEHRVPVSVEKAGSGFAVRLGEAAADVSQLEAMLDGILSADEADERLYDKINELYRGEYMEGCDYNWALARRESVKAKYIRSLRRFYRLFRRRGDAARAADSLQRLLAIEPDSEADGRELILLHLETGNRNEALRIYRGLEQAVRVQLGAELEEDTARLYRQLTRNG